MVDGGLRKEGKMSTNEPTEAEKWARLTNDEKAVSLLRLSLDNQHGSRSRRSLVEEAIKLLGYAKV